MIAFMDDSSLSNLVLASLFGLGSALLTTCIAALMGFFQIPVKRYEEPKPLKFSVVLWAFLIFLIVKYVVSPALLVIGYFFWAGQEIDTQMFMQSVELQGWFSLILIGILLAAYLVYFYVIAPESRAIAWGKSRNPIRDIFIGILTWLVAYPWIFALSHFIEYITWNFYKGPALEQLAVENLRMVMAYPVLFWLTAFSVVIVAPVIEELLFRGLLQTWLQQRIGVPGAIIITAIAFALLHFSGTQGIFNISILVSLFVLALFLGFLRVRQNSLLAPIALHSTVNLISFFVIVIQEKFNETLFAPAAYLFGFIWR